jgi:hypothetical protein
MPKFMLLLHETPSDFQDVTPEQMQAVIERYRTWSQGLAQAGKMAGGEKLKEEGGRHLRRSPQGSGRVEVTDGPYAEAREVMGGYFTIEAADYDEAVEVAKGCPHMENGWIEVRQVDEI